VHTATGREKKLDGSGAVRRGENVVNASIIIEWKRVKAEWHCVRY
jgi:hypothetical protein